MTALWYRSRSFWFGLAGLVMLLVTWASLPSGDVYFFWNGSSIKSDLGIDPWGIRATITGNRSAAGSGVIAAPVGFGRLTSEITGPDIRRFKLEAFCRMEFRNGVSLLVSHNVIVAVYVILWITGMVWWLRRKQRLMNAGLPGI